MKGTMAVYQLLVNQVPGIRERYQKKRNSVSGIRRIEAWGYLLGLNISYHVFRNRKLEHPEKYPYYEEKLLYAEGSESSISKRKSPVEFAAELSKYDVISFDVFDTLILRPFSSPADLFFLLGNELGYMDFKRIRMEMEWKAREIKYKKEKHYEVNLEEIYKVLSEETGINAEYAEKREVELEYEFCFANPYMKEVVAELQRLGKRIIITSDMYLNTCQIQTLLEECYQSKFDAYYVSCDLGKSKSRGDLYDEVRSREEKLCGRQGLTFVHVGDNTVADIENSEKHGFDSRLYVNVNAVGKIYRPDDMSSITGSVYRGLINAHIHNGLREYTREYEYGYIYGGLFVTGYCQFIHEYVHQHKTERILFLARDGDVLIKAYQFLYPEDIKMCRYVYWSRLAATKMAAKYFKYDYFRRFLYHKVNQGYTMGKILGAMDLDNMINDLENVTGLSSEVKLTDKNVQTVKTFLMNSWEYVLEHYADQLEAGKQYFSEILGSCKNAVAVDIGWAGSGAIVLDYIVNNIWNMDCPIIGIIAGTNTCHNEEPDASETFLQSGKLVSYLYSQRENRDLWKYHNPGKLHNLYWEKLLDAPMGSFIGFYLDKNNHYEFRFKDWKEDQDEIEEIQRGILEFVSEYIRFQTKMPQLGIISGRDAYAPMILVEANRNRAFRKQISGILDEVGVT